MYFPDNSSKIGIFENNVFKGGKDKYKQKIGGTSLGYKKSLPRSSSQASSTKAKPATAHAGLAKVRDN